MRTGRCGMTGRPPRFSSWMMMPTVRELTVSALEAMNYRVLAAENGRVALDVLRQADTVDLALIDLVMPVMNGRQLATRIRAADPERAILFMTGYDDLSGSDDPFAQEMVIKKPFKLVELAAAVERALARTRWRTTGMERDADPPAEEDMIPRPSAQRTKAVRSLSSEVRLRRIWVAPIVLAMVG